jgi:hypothetical protein
VEKIDDWIAPFRSFIVRRQIDRIIYIFPENAAADDLLFDDLARALAKSG